jgi:hypothetical protein
LLAGGDPYTPVPRREKQKDGSEHSFEQEKREHVRRIDPVRRQHESKTALSFVLFGDADCLHRSMERKRSIV